MSLPTTIYFLAILFIGTPAALRVTGHKVGIRNATALAMVAMWLVSRAVYAATGEWLPVQAMLVQDMVVIATIFAKHDWRDCSPYCNLRCQFGALWLERSPWDRAILALFVPAWMFYTSSAPAFIGPAIRLLIPAATDGQIQFWMLWGIGLAQLALAGHEAFSLWLRDNGQTTRADAPGTPPPRLMFAPVTGSEVYG